MAATNPINPEPKKGDLPVRKYASPFLTTAQAAEYLQVSRQYLQRLRITGEGPVFLRVSQRRVLYEMGALEAWLVTVRRRSTVDPGPEADNR